jgi:hypothetical protein
MLNRLESPAKQQALELMPDFIGEDRHEFVTRLAYTLWEERGRPLGSPEVDWFAAEQAEYSALIASGLVGPSAIDTPAWRRRYTNRDRSRRGACLGLS